MMFESVPDKLFVIMVCVYSAQKRHAWAQFHRNFVRHRSSNEDCHTTGHTTDGGHNRRVAILCDHVMSL